MMDREYRLMPITAIQVTSATTAKSQPAVERGRGGVARREGREGGGRRVSPATERDRKGREKALGAPVQRTGRGPRPVEKAAVSAFRAGAWLMGRLPVPIARGIVSVLLQASFVLWPK